MPATGPFVHFLMRLDLGGSRGWYAPSEVEGEDQQGGGFAVPVGEDRRLFPSYLIDVGRARGDGDLSVETHALEMTLRGRFALAIGAKIIDFRERRVFGGRRALPYLGGLSHVDFSRRLVEIEPERTEDLDNLFLDSRLVVIGCDPQRYGKLALGPRPSARSIPRG